MLTSAGDLKLRSGENDPAGPCLLALHGLGATGEVWDGLLPLVTDGWPGRWVLPDLPGHGGSAPLPAYSYGAVAAAVAATVPARSEVVVLGHSFGGVIGVLLASDWFGVRVRAVGALGVKVLWSPAEVARASGFAARPVAWFGSQDEAVARYLRVSGLEGLVPSDDPRALAGVRGTDDRWRLALDPATFAVGAPDVPGLLAAARAPVVWARGEHDDLVTDADLRALGLAAVTLPGLGHNAHVQDPAAVWALTRTLLSGLPAAGGPST